MFYLFYNFSRLVRFNSIHYGSTGEKYKISVNYSLLIMYIYVLYSMVLYYYPVVYMIYIYVREKLDKDMSAQLTGSDAMSHLLNNKD